MGDNYQWLDTGTAFDAAGSWADDTTGQSPAPNPPGPGDDAGMPSGSGTVSGNGDVNVLDVSGNFTFTGMVTAETSISFDPSSGSVTVQGGTLTGKMAISIYSGIINVTKGGSLVTNNTNGSPGAILNFGTLSVSSGTLTTFSMGDGGTLLLNNGQVNATDLAVGSNPGTQTSLDIGSGSTVSDSSGDIGLASGDDSSVTVHGGGVWTNSSNVVMGLGATATLDIEFGGSVSILGSGAPSGITPLAAGLLGGEASITIDGGTLSVTGDADIGASAEGDLTVSGGGSLSVTGTLDDGVHNGGSGTLSVSGGDADITLGDYIIGDAGAHSDTLGGAVTVEVTGSLDIGAQSGGDGTLTLAGAGALLSVSKDATVGGGGSGKLEAEIETTVDVGGDLLVGVGADSDGAVTLEIGLFTVGQGVTLGDDGSGSLELDGSGSFDVSGDLVLGAGVGGDGTISLSNGASLDADSDVTVGQLGSGSIDVADDTSMSLSGSLTLAAFTGSDGTISLGQDVTLTTGGDVTVGRLGTACIAVAAGATLDGSADTVTVGALAGSAGTITLTGTGAEVTADAMTLGGAGIGVISVADGQTLMTAADLTLGQVHGGGNGTVTVAGSGDLEVGGNMTVGSGGVGSLDVNGGSLSISGGLTIADGPASVGDVTFANASTSIGTITVGNQGTATFSANQAANVTATDLVLGATQFGNGTFNLDGSGSQVQAGSMQLGGAGTGALQVTNKAAFQVSGLATMGATAGAKVQETATIEANASWTIGSVLDIGQQASGVVTVDTGGQVAGASVVIGDGASASGTVTVTGTGTLPSALGFGSLLQVGNDGAGTLALAQGAQAGTGITSGTVEIAATAGASGTISLTDAGTELQTQLLIVGGNTGAAGGVGTLEIGGTADVSVADATVWPTGTVVLNGGTLATDPLNVQGGLSGSGLVTGAVSDTGTISASGGTLELTGSVNGGGMLSIGSGADFALARGVAAGIAIAMASGGATLVLSDLPAVQATVAGFAAGDRLVLDGVTADGGSFSGHTLTLSEGGINVGSLTLAGSYGGTKFHVGNAGGTTEVTVACFCAGTRLLTVSGEVAVEALAPGDVVVTPAGRLRPVRWIGHRAIFPDRHPRPWDVRPVRVQADAFAPGVPHRSLMLSPDHGVHWEKALIPVRYLINDATIRQETATVVVYYHVELDAHDIVLAEGMPAESYLDTGNRGAFANGDGAVAAHPDFALRVWETRSCAPLVIAGPALAATREKILERARALGFELTTDPDLRLVVDGEPLRAEAKGSSYRFTLPDGAREIRLVSRAMVPALVVAGDTDHRRIGVAVARLRIDGEIVPPGDPRRAGGWHDPEPGWQWTSGDAGLACSGARSVEVTLVALQRYWDTGISPRDAETVAIY